MSASTAAATLDVRSIPPGQRHAQIFGRFDALAPGEAFELVNDHDPKPLRYQFEDRMRGAFDWTYVESGPETWRVRIAKTKAKPSGWAEDSCCSGGSCAG